MVSSAKDMAQPKKVANVCLILAIILCIFLGVALISIVGPIVSMIGLTYCLDHLCITIKKKNELRAISRVESMKYHALNGIEILP